MPSATVFPNDPPEDLAGWNRYFGLPDDAPLNSLIRHLMGNAAATIGTQRLHIELLEERLDEAEERRIEAQNPGIDMAEVRRLRSERKVKMNDRPDGP